MWLVVGAIQPLTMVLVWFVILGSRTSVAGYDRGDFILYYIFMTVGWYIVGGAFCRQVGNAIHNGEINKTLLKPYNIVVAEAITEQAWKLTSLFVTTPILIVVLYLMRNYIMWKIIPGQWLYIIGVLVLGAVIFALIQAIVGILAFWVTEIWPFAETVDVVLYLFGGMLAPIELMPQAIQRITVYLPFRYVLYEPARMLLGTQPDPLGVLWKQTVFVVILFVIYRLVWRAGIRRYEGIGG